MAKIRHGFDISPDSSESQHSIGTVHNVLKLYEETGEVSPKKPEREDMRKIDNSGELFILGLLMHVKAWTRPYARARKYTEKIEYYTEVWLYYMEAWLWLTWQSIKKRVASEFGNVVSYLQSVVSLGL